MVEIPVTRSSMPPIEEFIEEMRSLWGSHWLTNMGEKHRALEDRLVTYLKVPGITLFANGHLALESAISAMELQGEVITTPFTFVSTSHAIVRNKLKPIFCDIDPNDYTIDHRKIESLITDDTCAIIPVHVYGNVCNVEAIGEIGKKYGLKVIYDAAHAFGVTLNGRGIGSFGDASVFSFHSTKVFNTIEGGAAAYSDPSLSKKLDDLKNFGITGPESVECVGGNAKMNELQAVMGICNIKHVDSEIEKRKKVAEKYYERLSGVKGIKLNITREEVRSNYGYMPIVFDGYKKNREEVFEDLRSHNIFPRKYFYPLINSLTCYKDKYGSSHTPTAEYVAERVLTLPIYADLAPDDVNRICEIILI